MLIILKQILILMKKNIPINHLSDHVWKDQNEKHFRRLNLTLTILV